MIRFEPKSGVSIKHSKALESLGWPSGSCYPDDSRGGTGSTMRTFVIPILAGLLVPLLSLPGQPAVAQTEPIAVDAAELGRRADLVGKIVVVDDRVRFYQYHAGRGYDELYLKRTNVVFRLPAAVAA